MFLLALSFTAVAFAADNRPRIRAVTAFIEVDQTNYGNKIEDAQKFLASAKGAFNRGDSREREGALLRSHSRCTSKECLPRTPSRRSEKCERPRRNNAMG